MGKKHNIFFFFDIKEGKENLSTGPGLAINESLHTFTVTKTESRWHSCCRSRYFEMGKPETEICWPETNQELPGKDKIQL